MALIETWIGPNGMTPVMRALLREVAAIHVPGPYMTFNINDLTRFRPAGGCDELSDCSDGFPWGWSDSHE